MSAGVAEKEARSETGGSRSHRLWEFLRRAGGWTGLGAGLATLVSLSIADRTADTAEQTRVAERLDYVQEHFKSSDVRDQIHGIQELQRIGSDAPVDVRKLAIDRIAAHIRVNTKANDVRTCGSPQVNELVEVSLEAIGRLNGDGVGDINLSSICLKGVEVDVPANLSNVSFASSDLTRARFVGVDLTKARFDWAVLDGTEFSSVNLTDAVFCYTDIARADFRSGTFVHTALQVRDNEALSQRSIDLSQVDRC